MGFFFAVVGALTVAFIVIDNYLDELSHEEEQRQWREWEEEYRASRKKDRL
jgi:hypothetical protein